MGQSFDGSFTAAVQHGAKQITLPLQNDGNYYATSVKRNYIAAPASGYEPIIGQRTAYTALLKYSDDLSQSVWTKAASTGTASAGTDPEGGSTATKLAEDNTNAAHNASQALTVAAGALSFGVLAKAAERTQFRLRIYNATDGSLGSTVFNLSTGAVTSGTGAIKKLLNGWYWCSVQTTPTVTNSTAFIDLTNDGSTFTYMGTTGSGVLLWRATAYLAAAIGPAVATTSVTRAVTSPAVDVDDPLAFLVSEMEPDVSTLEMGVARWGREYANVPAPTVLYSSQAITKPAVSTLGTARNFQLVTGSGSSSNLGANYEYNAYYWDIVNRRVYGPRAAITSTTSGGNCRVTWTGHGLAGTERIAIDGNSTYLFASGQYSIVDANTVDLTGWSALAGLLNYAAKYLRDYTSGTDRVGVKKTKTFYLPGITLGISTPTDIPIPSPLLNDTEFLAAIVATTSGYQTYDSAALEIWRGPIYAQENIAINMADV